MQKFKLSFVLVGLLSAFLSNVQAAEVCKVSMMGRVCFEEGSEQATAEHMKSDAVAQAKGKKVAETNEADGKKIATK